MKKIPNSILVIGGVVVLGLIYFFFMTGPSTTIVNNPVSSSTDQVSVEGTSAAPATKTVAKPVTVKTSSSNHVYIDITNFSFSPKSMNIKVGTIVTWTNKDSAPHTVIADTGGPTSNTLIKGQSYSFKYTVPGIYGYHCSIHPNMTGTVIVN